MRWDESFYNNEAFAQLIHTLRSTTLRNKAASTILYILLSRRSNIKTISTFYSRWWDM